MTSSRLAFFLFSLLLFTGCATRPVVTGDVTDGDMSWSLSGKLGVSAGAERGNYAIDWQQEDDEFEITLLGPLGMGSARVHGDTDRVVLDLPGEEPVVASNPDELLMNTMGFDFPVSQVRYWVRGRAAPGSHRKTEDGFTQYGWQIQYLAYQDSLPVRIRLTRPEVRLTMAIKQWNN